MLQPFMLEPIYRDYVWGGKRLRQDAEITAEAWIVYEENRVSSGPYAGSTLAEITNKEAETLLGSQVLNHTGTRFPLLIKLLDCAKWLSLQVHPNNEQALKLEGPGHFGKTEAWYVVEADKDAQLLGGFKEGVQPVELQRALWEGQILPLTQRHDVQTGDSIFIPAGFLHALGPGLLVYEVQQTSDITYRVYDWDRPMTAGRKLHLDQAAEVLNTAIRGELIPRPNPDFLGTRQLISSPYFKLDLIVGENGQVDAPPCQGSFSAFTVLDGSASISGNGWNFKLTRFESLVIPAIWQDYQIESDGPLRALRSSAT